MPNKTNSTRLTASVKTRILASDRRLLEKLAEARQLDLSDIAREALRCYLAEQTKPAAR